MARVKLRCFMGCPGLKNSYQEKDLLEKFVFKNFGFWEKEKK